MKTRKILSTVLALCLVLVLFAACSDGSDGSSTGSSAAGSSSDAGSGAGADTGDLDLGEYSKDNQLVLKIAHFGNTTNPMHVTSELLQEKLEAATGGAVTLEIYSDAVLGWDRELIEATQFGNIDMSMNTTSVLTNFQDVYSILDYPYLFKDWAHVEAFLDAPEYGELLGEIESEGLKVLGLIPRGFRNTTNNTHPIKTPEDFNGMKFRVIESTIFVETFKAFGANALAMSGGEVYAALQQGTIEGQENTDDINFDNKYYEVQTYLSATEHIFGFLSMSINKDMFDGLTADLQDIIETAADEVCAEMAVWEKEKEKESRQNLIDAGMEFNDDVDKDAFHELVLPVHEMYNEKIGTKYYDAIVALG